MIRVGIVGIGFMGWIHWLAYQRMGGARVTALHNTDHRNALFPSSSRWEKA